MGNAKTARIDVRLPEAGRDAVQAEADKEDRALADMARVLISEALRARKAKR
jgi:phosphohistidine phosphatase SixA